MPTYEYQCPACGTAFEKFQSISSPPTAPCEKCGTESRRLISGGQGIIFKGSGFYVTDYKKDGGKKTAAKSESSSETKTDSSKEAATPAPAAAPAPATSAPAAAPSSSGAGSSSPASSAAPAAAK